MSRVYFMLPVLNCRDSTRRRLSTKRGPWWSRDWRYDPHSLGFCSGCFFCDLLAHSFRFSPQFSLIWREKGCLSQRRVQASQIQTKAWLRTRGAPEWVAPSRRHLAVRNSWEPSPSPCILEATLSSGVFSPYIMLVLSLCTATKTSLSLHHAVGKNCNVSMLKCWQKVQFQNLEKQKFISFCIAELHHCFFQTRKSHTLLWNRRRTKQYVPTAWTNVPSAGWWLWCSRWRKLTGIQACYQVSH